MGTVPSRRGGRHGLVRSPSWILVIDKRAEFFYSSRLVGWEPAGDGGGEDRGGGGGRPRPPRLPPGGDPRELAALARGPRCVLGPSSSFLPLYPAPADRLEFFPGALRRTVTAADPAAVPDAETPRADGIAGAVAPRGAGGYFLQIHPAVLCRAPATLPVVTSVAQVHQRRRPLVVSLPSTHQAWHCVALRSEATPCLQSGMA